MNPVVNQGDDDGENIPEEGEEQSGTSTAVQENNASDIEGSGNNA